MLFVKCRGILSDKKTMDKFAEEDYRVLRKFESFIQKKTYEQRMFGNNFFFISDVDEYNVIIGAIVEGMKSFERRLQKYAASLELKLTDIDYEEVTFESLTDLIENADSNSFIRGSSQIFEYYGLSKLQRRWNRDYAERVISKSDKSDIFDKAHTLYIQKTLIPELERIYEGNTNERVIGHPVHYMIQSDDEETRDTTIELLIQSLYNNNRISSKRVTSVEFSTDYRFRNGQNMDNIDGYYSNSVGGTVVIQFQFEEELEGSHASSIREMVKNLSDMTNKYNNKVLTILCFPKECTKFKEWFYEYLGIISMVELKEEFVTGIEAKKVLKRKAKERHLRTDKQLIGQINEDKTYLLEDLDKDFDIWFQDKLKRTVYPQYQCIETVTDKKAKESPKGNSYDELNSMIGLTEARKVIDRALNYYKAQKLFRERGMDQETPSMHMVFTGNPGTAKTTVARLFADIMRDNGILSTGRLIEVGRGDLVGKYVGWTAPTVKRKFEDARGGVLFIDEAYSLVDDRDGMYGDEAINTIVQEMENHRDEVVVIFAGYPDKMEGFLNKNPGLRSRIAFHVPFEDYNVDELCEIAVFLAEKKGMHFTEDAVERLKKNFTIAIEQSDFGNGRYVRNVIEKARMAQASRLLKMNLDDISRDDIVTFCAEDIDIPKVKKETGVKMGFC